ncbi:MAG TPA: hypothetical protein VEL07_23695 [Planctomycetota bacterium]|nr:hypothetical protein [Planctomycetota bacterium]
MVLRSVALLITVVVGAAATEVAFVQRDGAFQPVEVDATGRYVACIAPTVPDTPDAGWDVFVLDRSTGTRDNITAGTAVDGLASYWSPVSLSGDARWVVFTAYGHVYLFDRATRVLREPSQGMSASSGDGAVSDDGRYVVFSSFGSPDLPEYAHANWLYDRLTNGLRRIGMATDGGRYAPDRNPCISRDGGLCVFSGTWEDGPGSPPHAAIFAHATATGATEVVSRSASGALPDGPCWHPAVNGDGRFVVFASGATNLAPGTPRGGLFLKDRLLGGVTLIQAVGGGNIDNGAIDSPYQWIPDIDRSGRFVAFTAWLDAADPNGRSLYRWDRTLDAVQVAAFDRDGRPAGSPADPSITADGRSVFFSGRDDILPGVEYGTFVATFVDGSTTAHARVNFQPAGAPVPGGYLVDSGAAFGARGNGYAYGWSSANPSARDRGDARSPDQRYDTLVHMRVPAWEFALPNGIYDVQVTSGDPSFTDSVVDLTIEDRAFLRGAMTAQRRWVSGHRRVTVADGRLTLRTGPSASNVKLCFVDIHRVSGIDAAIAARIDFQPASAPLPEGYVPDSGAAFGPRGNGLSYGWNAANPTTRDRNAANAPDQRYDTLIHMQRPENPSARWEIAVPDGAYEVRIVGGDPSNLDTWFDLRVEGVPALEGPVDEYHRWLDEIRAVDVGDGRLTVGNGPSSRNAKLSFLELVRIPSGPG